MSPAHPTHSIDTGPVGPGDGPPRSPAVLFLHGLGGSAESWRPQLDRLGRTIRCVAWTMPGYGPSAPLGEMSIAGLARAAKDLLDDRRLDRVDVVGHSLGGFVAQELALSSPGRVRRLVLVATTAAFGRPGSRFNEEFLASRLRPVQEGRTPAELAPDLVDGLVGPDAGDGVRSAAIDSMAAISPRAYCQAVRALVAWDARDRLHAVTAPTLCIAGALDATAPVRAVERLCRAIPGASLEVVADCGHLVNLEQPAVFDRLLTDFLHDG